MKQELKHNRLMCLLCHKQWLAQEVVRSLNYWWVTGDHLLITRANPKSQSLTIPFLETRMFSGFTSLWITWVRESWGGERWGSEGWGVRGWVPWAWHYACKCQVNKLQLCEVYNSCFRCHAVLLALQVSRFVSRSPHMMSCWLAAW